MPQGAPNLVDRALAILGLDEVPARGDFMRAHYLATLAHLGAVRREALEQAAASLPTLQEYAWLVRDILALRPDPAPTAADVRRPMPQMSDA